MFRVSLNLLLGLFIAVIANTGKTIGLFEVGVSANYKKSFLDEDAFDETQSYTGSVTYYFGKQSALELSFTNGQSLRFVPSDSDTLRTTYKYTVLGADLVITFAERNAPFIPYLKLGGAYFNEKKLTYEFEDSNGLVFDRETINLDQALVPSTGLGVKFRVTDSFLIKIGLEGWVSRPLNEKPLRIDYSGRAGLSWFL